MYRLILQASPLYKSGFPVELEMTIGQYGQTQILLRNHHVVEVTKPYLGTCVPTADLMSRISWHSKLLIRYQPWDPDEISDARQVASTLPNMIHAKLLITLFTIEILILIYYLLKDVYSTSSYIADLGYA